MTLGFRNTLQAWVFLTRDSFSVLGCMSRVHCATFTVGELFALLVELNVECNTKEP